MDKKIRKVAEVASVADGMRMKKPHSKNRGALRQLFELMGSGVAIYEAVEDGDDFVVKDINCAVEKIEHIRRSAILGKRVTEVFPGIKDFGILAVFQRVWKTGKLEYFPEAVYHDKRNPLQSWRENWVYKLSSGEIVAVYNEITTRKRTEQLLHKDVEWKDLLFWLYEEAGQLTDNTLYGHILKQVIRLTDSDIGFFYLVSNNQKEVILTAWNDKALKGCKTFYNTHYLIDQAGNWVDCVRTKAAVIYNDFPNSSNRKGLPEGHTPVHRFMSTPVMNEDKVEAIFGVGNKVDEYDEDDVAHMRLVANDLQRIIRHRRSEEALRASEGKYRRIFENAVEGIFQSTPEGQLISVNPALAFTFGYQSSEDMMAYVTDIGLQLYVDPKERTKYTDLRHKNGLVKGLEARFYRKDGTMLWGSLNIREEKDLSGRILYYEGTVEDITSRKLAEEELKNTTEKLRATLGGTINALSLTVEMRDPYTSGHQKRVSNLSRSIAQEMGLPKDTVENVRIAGVIHDIGKISVPAEILSKPTKLTDLEMALIRMHSQSGYDILKDSGLPHPIAETVLQHHERLDGSGYPQGLKGEEILLEARIIAVADVVEAMASHRPYRPSRGTDAALEEIEKNRGILYDPEAVEACLRLFREKEFRFE